ncbi:MAG: hypothetical protein BIP78_0394 [Candidatus Bipolaricaulis sibiricus]|uniref:Uncharacterized protein n=1 Tax=Bipolaricaulis sibiricus TaxID=2501609 RepID=A0A410FTA4_BIPS1|nr:MAG: hypothetical protein BIP78_0394 [Candidatus Bipolaricaulis sibiricus]
MRRASASAAQAPHSELLDPVRQGSRRSRFWQGREPSRILPSRKPNNASHTPIAGCRQRR